MAHVSQSQSSLACPVKDLRMSELMYVLFNDLLALSMSLRRKFRRLLSYQVLRDLQLVLHCKFPVTLTVQLLQTDIVCELHQI